MSSLNLILLPLGNWGPAVGQLVAFGILFVIPTASQMIQSALKTKDVGGETASREIMKGMSKLPFLKGIVS
jgi:hypothetical protein